MPLNTKCFGDRFCASRKSGFHPLVTADIVLGSRKALVGIRRAISLVCTTGFRKCSRDSVSGSIGSFNLDECSLVEFESPD